MAGTLLAAPLVRAQAVRTARIGYLVPFELRNHETRIAAFHAGMRALGYEEGKTYLIELRSPERRVERLPALATELVALKPDVLVTGGTRAAFALKRATSTIPIVASSVGDARASGLVASLARPDANVTGTTFFIQDLYVKRLELLREAMPRLGRMAVLIDPSNPVIFTNLRKMDAAAAAFGIALSRFEARRPEELEAAFGAIVAQGFGALVVVESPMLTGNVGAIAELAAKYRVPATGNLEFGKAGGLIGYGVDGDALYYRAAYFVDRILKGVRPADLPVEQPTKFEMTISLKATRALGITLPQSILSRADRVIE